jgi:hypothetical protein
MLELHILLLHAVHTYTITVLHSFIAVSLYHAMSHLHALLCMRCVLCDQLD